MWISLWWSSHFLSWYPPKSCKTLWCSYASVSSASVLQNTSAQDPPDSATHLVLWLDSTPLQSRPLHQKPGSCKRIKGYQGTRQRKPTMTKHMVESSLSTYWINYETELIIYPLSWLKLRGYTVLKAPLPSTSSYCITMPHKSGKMITLQFLKKSCLRNHKNQSLKKIGRKPLSLHDSPCENMFHCDK